MLAVIHPVETNAKLLTDRGAHAIGPHQQLGIQCLHLRPLANARLHTAAVLAEIQQLGTANQFPAQHPVSVDQHRFHFGLRATEHPRVRRFQGGEIQFEEKPFIAVHRYGLEAPRRLADRRQHIQRLKDFQRTGMQAQRPGIR